MGYYNPYYSSRPSRRAPRPRPNADPEIVKAYRAAHTVECDWIDRAARRDNDFACSLHASLNRYGSLTENQINAVRRCITRDATREAERRDREENAPAVAIGAIETAFGNARAAGIKRPKLRLAELRFSPAPASGANPGAVYVKALDGAYLGKVAHGRFVRSRECDADTERHVLDVCDDPEAAATAYGKQFGVCSCCGRDLTDPQSVARGIGPVCAKNYFGA